MVLFYFNIIQVDYDIVFRNWMSSGEIENTTKGASFFKCNTCICKLIAIFIVGLFMERIANCLRGRVISLTI